MFPQKRFNDFPQNKVHTTGAFIMPRPSVSREGAAMTGLMWLCGKVRTGQAGLGRVWPSPSSRERGCFSGQQPSNEQAGTEPEELPTAAFTLTPTSCFSPLPSCQLIAVPGTPFPL